MLTGVSPASRNFFCANGEKTADFLHRHGDASYLWRPKKDKVIRPFRPTLAPPSSGRMSKKTPTVGLKIRGKYGLYWTFEAEGNRVVTLSNYPLSKDAWR